MTKVFPPTLLPGTLLRQRLLDQIDANSHSKLLLIHAPAGYGKTTLLHSWLGKGRQGEEEKGNKQASGTSPFAWLTLDSADNDPQRFVAYLVAALRTVMPEIGATVEPLLVAPQLPPLEMIFTLLINEIAAKNRLVILALDDYHEIANDAIHAGLSFLIDHSPPNLRFAMTSRSEPNLPLSRWRVRRQLMELTSAELRFSADEVATFLQSILGRNVASGVVTAIDTKIEGWAAGLQLAALSLRGHTLDQPSELATFLNNFAGDHRYVFDYLAEEVLRSQPEDVRRFLLQTATLDRLCASLCDAVTGANDSAQRLNQLERSGLFLSRIGERGEWFRYHALFAEFLRAQTVARQSLIEQRAAAWFAQQELWSEAVKHALASDDFSFAGRTIANAIGYALSNGLIGELAGWLAALPDTQVRQDYELSVAKAWASYLTGQIPQAAEYIEVAMRLQPVGLEPGDVAAATALRGFLAAARHDLSAALEYCMEALEVVGEHNPALRSVILLNLAQVQWWLADSAALDTATEAMTLSERTGNPFGAMNALGTRSQILLMLGRLKEAQTLCESAIQSYRLPDGQFAPLAAIPLVTLGIAALEQGDFSNAEHLLRQGIELSELSGNHVPLVAGNLALIWTLLSSSRKDEAIALLFGLKEVAQHFGASAAIESLEAELRLADGDMAFARRWAERLDLRVDATPHHTQEGTNFVFARLLLAEERFSDALLLLKRIEQNTRQQGRLDAVLNSLILQAIAHQKLGEEKEAIALLNEATQLAAPEEFRRPFLIHRTQIEMLLAQLPSKQTHFLHSEPAISPSPNLFISPSPSLPEPLSERELDVLRLMATGLSNPEIAQALIVGIGTVKTHVHNILGKLGVRNRVEAIEAARQIQLIE